MNKKPRHQSKTKLRQQYGITRLEDVIQERKADNVWSHVVAPEVPEKQKIYDLTKGVLAREKEQVFENALAKTPMYWQVFERPMFRPPLASARYQRQIMEKQVKARREALLTSRKGESFESHPSVTITSSITRNAKENEAGASSAGSSSEAAGGRSDATRAAGRKDSKGGEPRATVPAKVTTPPFKVYPAPHVEAIGVSRIGTLKIHERYVGPDRAGGGGLARLDAIMGPNAAVPDISKSMLIFGSTGRIQDAATASGSMVDLTPRPQTSPANGSLSPTRAPFGSTAARFGTATFGSIPTSRVTLTAPSAARVVPDVVAYLESDSGLSKLQRAIHHQLAELMPEVMQAAPNAGDEGVASSTSKPSSAAKTSSPRIRPLTPAELLAIHKKQQSAAAEAGAVVSSAVIAAGLSKGADPEVAAVEAAKAASSIGMGMGYPTPRDLSEANKALAMTAKVNYLTQTGLERQGDASTGSGHARSSFPMKALIHHQQQRAMSPRRGKSMAELTNEELQAQARSVTARLRKKEALAQAVADGLVSAKDYDTNKVPDGSASVGGTSIDDYDHDVNEEDADSDGESNTRGSTSLRGESLEAKRKRFDKLRAALALTTPPSGINSGLSSTLGYKASVTIPRLDLAVAATVASTGATNSAGAIMRSLTQTLTQSTSALPNPNSVATPNSMAEPISWSSTIPAFASAAQIAQLRAPPPFAAVSGSLNGTILNSASGRPKTVASVYYPTYHPSRADTTSLVGINGAADDATMLNLLPDNTTGQLTLNAPPSALTLTARSLTRALSAQSLGGAQTARPASSSQSSQVDLNKRQTLPRMNRPLRVLAPAHLLLPPRTEDPDRDPTASLPLSLRDGLSTKGLPSGEELIVSPTNQGPPAPSPAVLKSMMSADSSNQPVPQNGLNIVVSGGNGKSQREKTDEADEAKRRSQRLIETNQVKMKKEVTDAVMRAEACRRAGRPYAQSTACLIAAVLLENLLRFGDAVVYYARFVACQRASGDKALLALGLNSMALALAKCGGDANLKLALKLHAEHFEIADDLGKFIALTNVGLVYSTLRMPSMASKAHKAALKTALDYLNAPLLQAVALGNLGLAFADAEEWNSASACLERYIDLMSSLTRDYTLSTLPCRALLVDRVRVLLRLGDVYFSKGDMDSAVEAYGHAADTAEVAQDSPGLNRARVALGVAKGSILVRDQNAQILQSLMAATGSGSSSSSQPFTYRRPGTSSAGLSASELSVRMQELSKNLGLSGFRGGAITQFPDDLVIPEIAEEAAAEVVDEEPSRPRLGLEVQAR